MKLRVSDISFAYNSHPILEDVSFSLEPGNIMCLMGVNGAGKSTLLKCINRILKPKEGTVFIGEQDLHSMTGDDIARKLGYVPQRHPDNRLNVFESILLGRRPHMGWKVEMRDYELVEGIIHEIGLEDLAMRPVNELSGGELQKVVIARALAQSPAILLLDEPTSNLDLKNQLEVMGLVRRIVRERGLSAIVAIHDLNIALRFGDIFLFLRDHRIYSLLNRDNLTEEIIRDVYGVEVMLNKVGDHIIVVPH
ncbi:MAG: ABC transporter ATP-binding protein [Deltaproteobacteria bacterium]|nr:ABC transporter ATP-binding protein [Deltaproteobacteria bacterium]